MKIHPLLVGILLVQILTISILPLQATVIRSPSAFGADAIMESFEAMAPFGGNLAIHEDVLLPSGALLLAPRPIRFDSFSAFFVGGGFFGLPSSSPFVPDGRSYVGQANSGLFDAGIGFELPAGINHVGAFIAFDRIDNPFAVVRVAARRVDGSLIEETIVPGPSNAEWADAFFGFWTEEPINVIEFEGDGSCVLRIDELTFEATAQVPDEAQSTTLLGLGLAILAARPGCRRRAFGYAPRNPRA